MSDAQLKAEQTHPDILVNGRVYPMWQQFVHRKDEWIGGILQDLDDDPLLGGATCPPTEITDVVLRENGSDSAWFEFSGKDYACGFDISVGGIGAPIGDELTLYGYGSMRFSVMRKKDL
jgi:hypothetical protein